MKFTNTLRTIAFSGLGLLAGASPFTLTSQDALAATSSFNLGNKVQVDTDLIITRPQTTSQTGQIWITGECGELIDYGEGQTMVNYCEGHVTISMTRAIDGILIDRLDAEITAGKYEASIEYLGQETVVVSATYAGGSKTRDGKTYQYSPGQTSVQVNLTCNPESDDLIRDGIDQNCDGVDGVDAEDFPFIHQEAK